MKKILASFLLVLSVTAMAHPNVLLYNVTDKTILASPVEPAQLSIASISKLMTVYTVLNENQNPNEILTVKTRLRNNTRLTPGMRVARIDLIKLSLVSSDNLAALTLGENFPGGVKGFADAMNKNAIELGMTSTRFIEPTGLDSRNISTLTDISTLTAAVSKLQLVRDAASSKRGIDVNAVKGKKTVKIHANPTISFFGQQGITTIKTGFTNAAGFCITMLINNNDKVYNVVILGARTKQQRTKLIEQSLKAIRLA